MSTPFYDLASLVVVPSGYKASKVYAQKPLTTDGQLTFSRASTATRVNSAGLIETVSSNVPRLDYTNSTCPKLILEPSRTNLALHSSAFDNAAWSKYQATITANGATSPDGSVNADKFLDSTANDSHALYAAYTISGDTTFSIFVKSAEYTRFAAANLSDGGEVIFNLSTATVVSTSANYKNAKIENYGNGWYRVSATTNGVSGSKAMGWALVNNAGVTTFAGTGTSGVFVYGAQAEAGAYPTSLINTTTAAVTRLADGPLSLPTAQTLNNFTLYWEGALLENSNNMLFGSGTSAWYLDIDASNGRVVLDLASGRKYAAFSALRANATAKLVMKRTAGVVEAFVNGVKLTPSTQVTDSTALSLVSIGWGFSSTYYPKMKMNQVLAFQSALTDAQCIELTAL